MSKGHQISIAKHFSKFPAGRYVADGPYPGELFRTKVLVPALKAHPKVVVSLDGTLGFGSSFLEEAFGGLVRHEGFTIKDLRSRLDFISDEDASVAREVWSYIDNAKPE